MKNIHILPTDKPSRLYLFEERLILGDLVTVVFKNSGAVNQHIYITSDEGINKDTKTCWCIDISCNELVLHQGVLPSYHYKHYKKIIMTTDKSINVLCSCGKDCGAKESGVQAIDDEFLEWFVKNPSCEKIIVNSIQTKPLKGFIYNFEYKIIIPKEEPKQNLPYWYETQEWKDFSKLAHNNFGGKPKMETLEIKRNYQKHSLTKTKGYKLWCNIIQRCYNPKNHSYKYYGEKGVIMEDYFKNSYENFIYWIKGIANYEKWLNSSELSLDRIDNTLGYVRGNIKFSTKTEQVENQNLRLDNKSGYKGVCYHKLNKKYGATITINKSKVFLGYYDTALEAALVYDNYVLKNNLNRKTNL